MAPRSQKRDLGHPGVAAVSGYGHRSVFMDSPLLE
jgi:hypothetical protein